MSGSLTAPTPNVALNDFSGRHWPLATESRGDGSQAIVVAPSGASAGTFTASGGALAAAGVAQNAAAAWASTVRYIIVQNPPDAASQGIATAENLFVRLGAAAVVNGTANFAVLAPGQSVTIGMPGLRPDTALTVSVNAATIGHQYLCTLISTA